MNWRSIFKRNKRIDKFFYGEEGFPKLSIRYRVTSTLAVLFMLGSSGLFGYIFGYYEGTGLPPFIPAGEAKLPPSIEATTTQEVDEFLETNDISMDEYDIGFNCVEFTLLQARNAHWEGIPAAVVRIDLEGEASHMIIGFPTKDTGWLFVEPQENIIVSPRVGGDWLGRRIVGLYYLEDFLWASIEGE